jgi:lipoyl-dependent peroxiredoxin
MEITMINLEKVLYTAKAHTTGGRDGGSSRTDDGRLEVQLSTPGKSQAGTNPEQLFAVGWSACFLSAIKFVAGRKRIALPGEVAVDAEVELGIANGGHHLAARLTVTVPGVEQATAQSLVDAASHVCPYSLATHGNINVRYNVRPAQVSDRVGQTQHA